MNWLRGIPPVERWVLGVMALVGLVIFPGLKIVSPPESVLHISDFVLSVNGK